MPKFPLLVRRGSAAVSIRPYQNNGAEHFLITWNVLGKRHRESRSFLDAAKHRAEEIATAISNGKIDSTELSGADRDSYRRALSLLEPLGIPLHAAVEEFVAARTILGSDSLMDAAREHAMRNVTALRSGTVPELVEKCITQKEQDGLSARYDLEELRQRHVMLAQKRPVLGAAEHEIRVHLAAQLDTRLAISRGSHAMPSTAADFAGRSLIGTTRPVNLPCITFRKYSRRTAVTLRTVSKTKSP